MSLGIVQGLFIARMETGNWLPFPHLNLCAAPLSSTLVDTLLYEDDEGPLLKGLLTPEKSELDFSKYSRLELGVSGVSESESPLSPPLLTPSTLGAK